MSMKRQELIDKIQKEEAQGKKGVSLVVVGEYGMGSGVCMNGPSIVVFNRSCRCWKVHIDGKATL